MRQYISDYISDTQLAARYGVSRSTIWRWTQRRLLPSPVKLSTGCTRWRLDQVLQRDAARDAQVA